MAAEGPESPPPTSRPSTSFNGAAAGWPRKGVADHLLRRGVQQLQWGRGRMAAEGSPLSAVYGRPVASMGPRPDGRGRIRPRTASTPTTALQWGRGRMAAEGLHAGGRGGKHTSFNGAAAGWPRKADGRARLHWAAVHASMGPRPDGRGRWPCHVRACIRSRASMGPRPDGRGRAWQARSSF